MCFNENPDNDHGCGVVTRMQAKVNQPMLNLANRRKDLERSRRSTPEAGTTHSLSDEALTRLLFAVMSVWDVSNR